jgi:hypothetical protein
MSRPQRILVVLFVTAACVPVVLQHSKARADGGGLRIDAEYPGGNIIVDRIEGDQVHLRQDLRDTTGWWFYWNFRVQGAAGRSLEFTFDGQSPIGVRGPAVSTNGGKRWSWLGAASVQGSSFRYDFARDVEEVRFSFAIPYVEADLRRFLAAHEGNPNLSIDTLCRSRKGRDVERLEIVAPDCEPSHRILLTARHHACESMANYAMEGFISTVLDDTDTGCWFRQNAAVLAIPFVDKDGVQDGDQGKNRKPYDHNRDYKGESIYPSVAAIRALVPEWSRGNLSVAIDLHCPWIRGAHNEAIYMVGKPKPDMWNRQVAFGEILERIQQGPLRYRASDNLPFGTAWNTRANYGDRMSCSMWAASLDGIGLATSLELPYANAAGNVVDADSSRAFGRDLARAVQVYLTSRGDQSEN